MKIFICGMDGYLGWSFRCRMITKGHDVNGCDNFSRRFNVGMVGSDTAIPIRAIDDDLSCEMYDITKNHSGIAELLRHFNPDVIVHLAENPSAPFSMISGDYAMGVQYNNIIGSLNLLYAIKDACPDAHLIKLGTMGEYGTPNIDITEGDIEINHNGRKDQLPFPCQPLSFYHASKVADSVNIRLACKLWGLRCTDVMQGIVYGTSTEETRNLGHTRFDFDECFGTVINRFCAQAVIGHPLTVYGKGTHRRALLPLDDSMECLDIICHNKPAAGEYRVINQFEQYPSMNILANTVKRCANRLDMPVEIQHIDNPRVELDKHYYNPDRNKLIQMGYKPSMKMGHVVTQMLEDLLPYKERITKHKHAIMPKTRWVA